MGSARAGLQQIVEFAHPRTLRRLKEAGAMNPKSPLALGATLPWLLGRGPSLGIVLRMNAIVLGDKPAIHDRNGTISWRELDARVNQLCHALKDLGLTGGDSIAVLLRNGTEFAEAALASQRIGLVGCPLNTWAKLKELRFTLANSGASLLIYDTAHSEQVEAAAPEGMRLVFVGDPDEAVAGSLPYEELVEPQSNKPPSPFTRVRASARMVIHTSGTTGTPKGAARDSAAAGMGALANLLSVVPYRRDDVVFCPTPMFHSFGLATFTFATALGATMVLPSRFDPEESLAEIERHRATAASFVPVMLSRICALDEDIKKRYDLSSLRIVLASGSALSTELRNAARRLFGDVLYDLYGSTEVGWVTIATPEDMQQKPKSVGKPVPGTEVVAFTDDGRRLPPRERGELFIKSKILFDGYTSGESRDEREGHMSIGDVGWLDEEGYLYIEGRADDMVVVGGENVYPIEIEETIEALDDVREAAVMGIDDDEYGKVLAAFYSGSAEPDHIQKVCEKELASYKVPKRVVKLDELPRTSTGKVIKRELVKELDKPG